MGLAPILVEQIFDIIKDINAAGTTVLLVEQNALMALGIAARGYILQTGEIVLQDSAERLIVEPRGPEGLPGRLDPSVAPAAPVRRTAPAMPADPHAVAADGGLAPHAVPARRPVDEQEPAAGIAATAQPLADLGQREGRR